VSEIEVRLADVGEGLDEAEIVNWLVAEGEPVLVDEDVVEIETAKSVVAIPAPRTGIVVRHAAAIGEMVSVGGVMYSLRVDDESETIREPGGVLVGPESSPISKNSGLDASMPQSSDGLPPEIATDPYETSSQRASRNRRPLASPAIRKRAREQGVDLTSVKGTGTHGRVIDADLRAALKVDSHRTPAMDSASSQEGSQKRAVVPDDFELPPEYISARSEAVDRKQPLRGIRKTIALNMVRSWRTAPHITDVRRLDVHRLVRARAELNQVVHGHGARYSYMPFLIKAVALAARDVPSFNASVDEDGEEILFKGSINVGVATGSDRGLVIPVIPDADKLSLRQIRDALEVLVPRARAGALTAAEMSGGTITITNYGAFGGWIATPIIRPPESACVGFGRLQDEVVAEDGQPVVRSVMAVSISGDHRIIDGSLMGAYFQILTRLLEYPIALLEHG